MSNCLEQISISYKPIFCQIKKLRIGIVYSEWNKQITHALRDGAVMTLLESGLDREQILEFSVPGAFELNYAVSCLIKKKKIDAIIALGCVIRGDTSHYDCICNAVTNGMTQLNLKAKKPVIFGLVTTENLQQALDRSGGKLGNKGCEAAITSLQMLDFSCKIEKDLLPL